MSRLELDGHLAPEQREFFSFYTAPRPAQLGMTARAHHQAIPLGFVKFRRSTHQRQPSQLAVLETSMHTYLLSHVLNGTRDQMDILMDHPNHFSSFRCRAVSDGKLQTTKAAGPIAGVDFLLFGSCQTMFHFFRNAPCFSLCHLRNMHEACVIQGFLQVLAYFWNNTSCIQAIRAIQG